MHEKEVKKKEQVHLSACALNMNHEMNEVYQPCKETNQDDKLIRDICGHLFIERDRLKG